MKKLLDDSIIRYAGQTAPRYTSYPTAVEFSPSIDGQVSGAWLSQVLQNEAISLYIHVPFCHEMCSFCGCNTSVVRSDDIRAAYGLLLIEELHRVAGLLGQSRRTVSHIHWGGGTPTSLPSGLMIKIMREIGALFVVEQDAECCIEVDPRHFHSDFPGIFGELGITRVSLGVQDFDERVQKACGRLQSYEQTARCIEMVRSVGIKSVNVDLMYGLAAQTVAGVSQTARDIASLSPDRLAVFGYAHVPWKQARQRIIDAALLPDAKERVLQCLAIDEVLVSMGYVRVGLDHYARPDDRLARAAQEGTMRRNFQGYTVDSSPTLIGIGASAISAFRQGFTQNEVSTAAYARVMGATKGLPVARGVAFARDDVERGQIIERLMCDLAVDIKSITSTGWREYGQERAALEQFSRDGLVVLEGSCVTITQTGRVLVRLIAAVFDRYAEQRAVAHAVVV